MTRRDNSPKSQAAIEAELEALSGHLEALTNGGPSPMTGEVLTGYDEILEDQANAEVDWKLAFAQKMIQEAGRSTDYRDRKDLQEARATMALQEKLRRYKIATAVAAHSKEALATTRAQMDAKRTQAANVRAQT